MYSYICYFLLDVRANQSSRAWVPWSIDSFEKYSTFVYFTCIILSHIHIYLLFSFGCSGEPVQSCVSSLKYRFLWKYSTFVYFTCIISSHIRIYLLFSCGCSANRPDRAWVPWSIDSFENTLSSCTLHANIISCTQISLIFFWMFGRTSPVVREFPEV